MSLMRPDANERARTDFAQVALVTPPELRTPAESAEGAPTQHGQRQ